VLSDPALQGVRERGSLAAHFSWTLDSPRPRICDEVWRADHGQAGPSSRSSMIG
jgi:hypothetical protein